jgi:putative lipoprotein
MFDRPDTRIRRTRARDRAAAIGLRLVLSLVVVGCSSNGPSGSSMTTFPLAGTSWRAVEIEGRPTDPAVASTLTFEGDQRVAGSTGCNLYTAPMSATDTSIRVGVIAMTRRACPPPVSDQETRFTRALEAAREYRQEENILRLLDEQGRSILLLARS